MSNGMTSFLRYQFEHHGMSAALLLSLLVVLVVECVLIFTENRRQKQWNKFYTAKILL